MAIRITEDGVVNYENSPDVNRKLFPNLNICGKAIDELAEEIDGKAPAVFSTTSGSIASFDNGAAADMPLKSCVVSFSPIQEGEGDPSPENVRPISGRTGLSVVRCGKNLLNPIDMKQWYITGSNKVNVSSDNRMIIVPIKKNTVYVFTHVRKGVISGTDDWNVLLFPEYPVPNQTQGVSTGGNQFIDGSRSFNSGNNTYAALKICNITKTDYDATLAACQFELGSTATDYESYKGSTYSVNWEAEAGTVYGGTLDVVSGKLTVDSGYIASYNGETLPSTWISDRDAYAAGTTPTTGAQVVYKLAEPIEYQLTPQEVRTLLGVNNIWSDAGNVSVEFPADTKTYIDDLSIKTVEVTGQTPTITAEENTRYICGEVTSLTFTPSEKGICDVRFTAASISTVLTLPETVKLPEWFDPTLLEANTTYEINVLDGIYGVVMSWV